MTKSIIINYNEADENTLMAIFQKFKVKIKPIVSEEKDYGDKGVPKRVAENIIEGLALIKKYEAGEIELEDWSAAKERMKLELLEEENVLKETKPQQLIAA
jgi:hypothetical protein